MKKVLFLICSLLIYSVSIAQHIVKGKVTGADNEVLIGVNILEKGTSNGTVTDVNGNYELKVSSSTSVIVFSYIGYDSREIALKGESQLDVTLEEQTLRTVQVVGSRSYNRSATDSPVPIDVIDVADLTNSSGRVEINQLLQYAVPSFNATKQSGSDGADHIDPASLRGLGPDQTLVLINGKRRHQSSLVNVFGTRGRGNTGTDLNAIPASAIKRIEVLRDGASAQYGSDAIAGVINIVLKDQTDGLTGGFTYGAYSTAVGEGYAEQAGETLSNIEGENRIEGGDRNFDGNTYRLNLNYGTALGNKGGFANVTAEYYNKERTLRPSYPWRQGYGSAAIEQFQFMVNAAIPLSDKTDIYAFGGRGDRNTDAYAFTRDAPGADGDSRSVPSLYPNGFNPHITSRIIDNSITGGVRHKGDNGWNADFSHTRGSNNFHYFVTGTNNASLGSLSPTDFDAGGHRLIMNTTNLDFSKFFESIASGLNIAYGLEYRNENFQIFAGEEGSYASYDTNGIAITNPDVQSPFVNEFGQQPSGGSQGFPGYSPANEVDRERSNFGVYADAELNITEELLVSGALRFENYSDFGNTFNYKLAARYEILDGLSIRASASSGFRAPSLAQIHYNLLFNNIVAGRSQRTLLAANTSTITRSAGINPLKQETAQNSSLGATYSSGGFTATVDIYQIDVKDRIVLTDNFSGNSLGLDPSIDAVQFFANGIDTKTTGLDFVLGYKHELSTESFFSVGIAGNFNNTDIEDVNNGNLNEFTFFGPFSQAYLEAAAPDYKFGINASYSINKFNISLNWTQYSSVTLQDFQWVDSPPTTQAEADDLFLIATDEYEGIGTLDISLGYKIFDNLSITIGGNNILNAYPTPQFDGWTDQGGFNDSVQIGSDGAYFFGRIGFNF